jgi:cobalamin biosynthesis Mg chelatase CobN
MPEIKTKESFDAQDVFEGVTDLGDRMRWGLGRGGDYARKLADDGQVSSTEYASDQFQHAAEDLSYEAGHIAVDTAKGTIRNVRRVHKYIQKKQNLDTLPRTAKFGSVQKAEAPVRQAAQTANRATVKTAQKTIKDSQRAVKASREATKASIKTAQETARAAEKTARAAATTAKKTGELLREAAKVAAEAAKAAAKAIAAAAKAVAATVEEIAGAIAAGGWVLLVIIAVVIIIGMIILGVIGYVALPVTAVKQSL